MQNFKKYSEAILKKLKENKNLTLQGNWTIMEFFVNQSIQEEISGNIVIGGPTLPLVVMMNTDTGEVKYFSLKFLIGDLIENN